MKYDIAKCQRVMDLNGWSQGDVAERAKVSQSLVSNFFTGKSIRRASAKKIIEGGLGLKMEDVLRKRARVA